MKDRQAPQTIALPRIPVVSAVLHCLSMPVIVYLRSGFGYAFLRPKSIFLAFSWALVLFTLYSWLEPGMWRSNAALCLFGLGAVFLYCHHLIRAFSSELRGNASHDHHSGNPHLLRILRRPEHQSPEQFRSLCAIWAEPALVLLAALAARWLLGAANLSAWLLLCAISLWLKESLNFWLQLRQRKRHRDAMEDAEDSLDGSNSMTDVPPPSPSRKSKVTRPRAN